MDDLHSSRHLYCSLFSPRYLEKEKRTKYCNYEIVTITVSQHTSLWNPWFTYFFRDSQYGKRYVDCRPCYSLHGKLLGEGTQRGAGCPRLQRFPPPPPTSGIQVLLKKNPEPSTWKPVIRSVESWIQDQWRIQERGPVDPAPPYFYTKLRPEGRKKIFLRPGPSFCQGLDDRTPPPPPLIWRSGSATEDYRLLRDWESNFIAVHCSNKLISKFSLPLQEFVILAANIQGRRNK